MIRTGKVPRSPVSGNNQSPTRSNNHNSNSPLQIVTTSSFEADSSTDHLDSTRFRSSTYVIVQAALLGMLSGWFVGIFKLSIDAVRTYSYHRSFLAQEKYPFLLALIPALGGLAVGGLRLLGDFAPGLLGIIELSDDKSQEPQSGFVSGMQQQFKSFRKSMAAIITLGSGCSLGPEGPSVEIGLALSRMVVDVFPRAETSPAKLVRQNRLLLACGAAAGVSAGFNAPIAGVFFALEIMQNAFVSVHRKKREEKDEEVSPGPAVASEREDDDPPSVVTSNSSNISAILLASVLSALISRALVGEHLDFTVGGYAMSTPLLELPLYLLLGATSGMVAFLFSKAAKLAQAVFAGESGPSGLRRGFKRLPLYTKPMLGGLLCGAIGLAFPQILFSGYETLNGLLSNNLLPTSLLLGLLALKIATTALCVGSGLVGGTFAPSLFLGGMVGGAFHGVVSLLFFQPQQTNGMVLVSPALVMSGVPAYAMMGSASVLAAVFRAPLTASLLLFELTRDYNVIVPVMASCGVASVIGDVLEYRQEERKRRDRDPVSWGDLSDTRAV
jgi:H+/Cl- antiporter ClcA